MKTFRPGEVARAEDVNANFTEVKRIADEALPSANIRKGTLTVPRINGNSNLNIDIVFDTPLPSSNYIVYLTVGGSGGLAPEYILASYKTNGLRTHGFAGRVRNTHNSAQGCVISYLAIAL